MVRICFVCLGNICRSPTAEAVMRELVHDAGLSDQIHIESAGTGAYHAGESPDRRSIAAGRRRGFSLSGEAQQFRGRDWDRFDYVIAMDTSNHADLSRQAPTDQALAKLSLLRSFDPESPEGSSVPDPYYSDDGFDEVIDLCEAACRKLLAHVTREHGLRG